MNKIILISFLLILIVSVGTVSAIDLNDEGIDDNFQDESMQNDYELLSSSSGDDLQSAYNFYEFYDSNISNGEIDYGQKDIELSVNTHFMENNTPIYSEGGLIVYRPHLQIIGGNEWYDEYTDIEIYIDSESIFNTTVIDGNNILNITLQPIDVGLHEIKAVLTKAIKHCMLISGGITVPLSDEYVTSTIYSNLTVNRSDLINLSMNNMSSKEDHMVIFQVNAKDSWGNNLNDLEFEFYKNGEYIGIAISDDNGNAKLDYVIPKDSMGTYEITAMLKNNRNFFDSNVSSTLLINNDIHTKIISNDLTIYYGNGSDFTAQLTELDGTAIPNQAVTLEVNGINYTRTTDKNGFVYLSIHLNRGEYGIEITHLASDSYLVSCTNNKIIVLPTTSSKNLTKRYRDSKNQFTAQFFDGRGNNLSNESVSFNINGVTYWHKTDSNGYSILNINLIPGNYIITSFNPVTGEMTSNNITVLSLLTGNKNLTKYYRNDSQYTVNVWVDGDKAVGASVKFFINGVFYERQSDEAGIAKLNINLVPGEYVITAEYSGCMVSNSIKVLSVLNASDITMNYCDGTKFTATLVDGEGKAFANQNVTFYINDALYNRTTDSSGQAKLNINLMPGEYIITSSYNGASIVNKVTIG